MTKVMDVHGPSTVRRSRLTDSFQATRPDIYLEKGEDKAAEACIWLLLFAGASKDEVLENTDVNGQYMGPIIKNIFKQKPVIKDLGPRLNQMEVISRSFKTLKVISVQYGKVI